MGYQLLCAHALMLLGTQPSISIHSNIASLTSTSVLLSEN